MQTIDGFAGRQLGAGDPGYDEARALFNGMIDARPALIARCEGADDIARAVAHALHARRAARSARRWPLGRRHEPRTTAASSSTCDPERHQRRRRPRARVRCGAGVTWADFDRATQEHGLATTGGRVSTTGVAGLTLGGGSGWLERLARARLRQPHRGRSRHGRPATRCARTPTSTRSCSGRCAAAEGTSAWRPRSSSASIRWGRPSTAGWRCTTRRTAASVLRTLRDFYLARAARGRACLFMYMVAPPEPFVPEEWQGRLVAAIAGMWIGAAGRRCGRAAPAGERRSARRRPLRPSCRTRSCSRMIDDPPGMRNWWTADYLDELPDAAVDAFCAHAERMPRSSTFLLVIPWGGAVARASDASLHAEPRCGVGRPPVRGCGRSRRGDDEHIAWGRASHSRVRAVVHRRDVPELHRRRGPRQGPRRRSGRPTNGSPRVKAECDPGQRLPGQPEHQARTRGPLARRCGARRAPVRRSLG